MLGFKPSKKASWINDGMVQNFKKLSVKICTIKNDKSTRCNCFFI
jgi:hypothetical protein